MEASTAKPHASQTVQEQIECLRDEMRCFFKKVMKHLDKHDERLKDYIKEFESFEKDAEKHFKKMKKDGGMYGL